MQTKNITDNQLREMLAEVLQLRAEDWGDVDARLLFARVLRLQAQIRALQEHHRAVHPACGHAGAKATPPRSTRETTRPLSDREAIARRLDKLAA